MNSQIEETTEEAMWVATQRNSRPSLGMTPSRNLCLFSYQKVPRTGEVCVDVGEEQRLFYVGVID